MGTISLCRSTQATFMGVSKMMKLAILSVTLLVSPIWADYGFDDHHDDSGYGDDHHGLEPSYSGGNVYGPPAHGIGYAGGCPNNVKYVTVYRYKNNEVPVYSEKVVPKYVPVTDYKTIERIVTHTNYETKYVPQQVTTTLYKPKYIHQTLVRTIKSTLYEPYHVTDTQYRQHDALTTVYLTDYVTKRKLKVATQIQHTPVILTKTEVKYTTAIRARYQPQPVQVTKQHLVLKTVCPKKGYY